MSWFWTFESASGEPIGQSQTFDSRGDAETWVGEMFSDLLDDGTFHDAFWMGRAIDPRP